MKKSKFAFFLSKFWLTKDNFRHLQDDLNSLGAKNFEDMTDEDLLFYNFKLHDYDNNDHLDGLELLHAATHQQNHNKFKVLREGHDPDTFDEALHIGELIDNFIAFADIDQNGFLTYPEYINAMNATPQYPELQEL